MSERDLPALERTRDEIRARHLRPSQSRPTSSARGVHHVALLSSDVERTVRFYQDLLEFPLTDMFENRDYQGSTHFFFDIGNGNSLAFFDLPGLDLGPYAEVLGGLHHLAISVEPERWNHLKAKLDDAGIEYAHIDGSSIYFSDPDGARLELISDPLGEMYGKPVLDGSLIPPMRTAAASALATRLLARANGSVVAIVGSGVQAGAHVEALRCIGMTAFVVAGRDFRNVSAFAEKYAIGSASSIED